MKSLLKKLRDICIIENGNLTINKGRKEPHIRITNCSNIDKDIVFGMVKKDLSELNTNYSDKYLVHYVVIEEVKIPIVLCHPDYAEKGGSVRQKELSPSSLKIKGFYQNSYLLKSDIDKAIAKTSLNNDLKTLAYKLCNMAIGSCEKLTKSEIKDYKNNKFLKDFGELLTALNILDKNNTQEIEFNTNSNGNYFDLTYTENNGFKRKVNVKSGSGSGQSLKPYYSQLKRICENTDIEKSSKAYKYLDFIKTGSQPSIKGVDKILEMGNILSSIDDDLGRFLMEINLFFFQGFGIHKDFFLNSFDTYDEYSAKILQIQKKLGLKEKLGLPTGSKDVSPSMIYSEVKGKINGKLKVMLFLIGTFIDQYSDDDLFHDIMVDILTKEITIVHISINKDGELQFVTPQNPKFKISYWAHAKTPTNNLIGFKEIY